jgi:hypothetical protein
VNAAAVFDFGGIEKAMLLTLLGLLTDHALCQQFGKRFGNLEITKVSQYPGIKPGIKEVEDGMFNAPYILIHGHPIIYPL